MKYLISDTHLNHKNIILYEERPFQTIEEMNIEIVNKWNSTVSNKDTIYHLGDFAWGNKKTITELVSQLNGFKILIKGNHDGHSVRWYLDAGFDTVIDGGIILDNFYLLTYEPIYISKNMPYINIHGHIHSQKMESKQYINVSVEHINYTPILFELLKSKAERDNEDLLGID